MVKKNEPKKDRMEREGGERMGNVNQDDLNCDIQF